METYILKTKDFGDIIEQTYYLKKDKIFTGKKSSQLEISSSTRSRAISRIKEICYCNDFDYFFTITLKNPNLRLDNVYSIKYINDKFRNYYKLAKYRNIKFIYVYVFELTKKGAIHCHGFGKGFFDLYTNEYNHLSSKYFDDLGFQNYTDSKKVNVNYLIKYIMKQPVTSSSLYHASRGLNKADVTIFHDYFNKFLDFPFTYKNKFCKMITYKK